MGWTRDKLIIEMKNQITMLVTSCLQYDRGQQFYALEIAHKLRVLLHDTSHLSNIRNPSHSILKQLNAATSSFYSTKSQNPNHTSMVVTILGKVISGQFFIVKEKQWWNGNQFTYFPVLESLIVLIPFQDWWEKEIICIYSDKTLTRKQLVLKLSNKLGGSHLDPSPETEDLEIYNLDSKIFAGWTVYDQDRNIIPHRESPFLASIRQIAHEVLESFNSIFNSELQLQEIYYSKIEYYRFLGYNLYEWLVFTSKEPLSSVGHYVGATISKKCVTAFGLSSSTIPLDSSIEKLQYTILWNDDGRYKLIDNGLVDGFTGTYNDGDRFGFILLDRNSSIKLCYLQNGRIIYESKEASKPLLYKAVMLFKFVESVLKDIHRSYDAQKTYLNMP